MFQQPVRPAGHVHVEFKAGRMDWDGRMVTPDKRKGKVILYTSEEEALMHFQWMDREKNEVSQDLIVINDAYLERIEKCTTGRVYLLRFTSSDKKLFFWMQEPKEETDADVVKRFNEAIGAKIPEKGAAPQADLRAVLQQFLQNQGAQAPRSPPVPLGAVLTTEVLQSLLTDEAACAEMMGLLPETHRTTQGLRDALASPQLQQNISSLSQAVHSDQLPVLLASLGLGASAVGAAGPDGADALEVLCRAMEAQGGGSGEGSSNAGSGAAPGGGEGGAAPGSG